MKTLTDSIINVGESSYDVDLFEGQYIVPNGMAYNSYVVLDEKVALFDGVDVLVKEKWLQNIKSLNKNIDYFIISHLEPDHSSSIVELMEEYKDAKLVINQKALNLLKQFYKVDYSSRAIIVKDNDNLNIGSHTFHFVFAPMVHWPEVMMTYEDSEKVLFAADAFGKFGALDYDEDWACEARRYYFNIVGKYGMQVQAVLKKLADKPLNMILGLHGPALTENLNYYINLYDTWSSYRAEVDGVFIAFCSIYGNTKKVAYMLKEKLEAKGVRVSISDLARSDFAENIEDAFKYSKLVLASPTTDNNIFPIMNDFIEHLLLKNYQNRTVGFIENGSWAPQSGKLMRKLLENQKDINLLDEVVTIKSSYDAVNNEQLDALVDSLTK